ncbi:thioesterase family protein [Shouchella clausii]|uniref:acyl-CoA thioesterase n=1 Tax=Shouchella TaxID=2893057 RepID=UPI0004E7BC25|nr:MULTISPECIES: thioesterase family protein [Shouchella]ALA54419.1 Thioesterase superfamily [Shouchella clausii]MBU3232470.1 acyl-CoA thioesterase [Shouchella clausii]MBU3265848.1 acyl-CoA thioesterase [Shouchella clausii]MBU3505970.1 acyl-CoA thioesterase [Shouchella clausii]MBU3535844.1 acyl-CoA thioesterase [Shouchella clausii]
MKVPAYINEISAWEDSFTFFVPIKVRFSETDAFGHVNNTSAFIYFEHARLEFFESCGLMEDWAAISNDAIVVTADLQCNYVAQIQYGDTLQVGVKVDKIGRSSLDIHYVAKRNTDICLTGRGTVVQVDKQTGKALPFSEKMLAKLACKKTT